MQRYILKTFTHNAVNILKIGQYRKTRDWVGPDKFPPVYLNFGGEWSEGADSAQPFDYDLAHLKADALNYERARNLNLKPSGLCIVEEEPE